jgi:hypothetical protein
MAYTLYTDKNENFICEVSVKNASLKDAFARMVVQTDNLTLLFEGQLKDGKCTVPINRLKGLIEEDAKGKMHLEVIVEDTYFRPWEDEFVVEQHTAVKVQVAEQKKPSKPIVEVKTINKPARKLSDPATDIVFICEKVGITKDNLIERNKDFKQVVKEYFKSSPEFVDKSKIYIKEAVTALK